MDVTKAYNKAACDRNRKAKMAYVNSQKCAPCMDCKGSFQPCQMDFDHRDPSTKIKSVAQMIQQGSFERVKAEITKCDLVCANCHRLRTFKQYGSN